MLNDRQKFIVRHLLKSQRGVSPNSAGFALRRAGLTNRRAGTRGNDCLSGGSVLRSLERLGLVLRSPPRDQWDGARYCLTKKGEEVGRGIAERLSGVNGEPACPVFTTRPRNT